MPKKPKKILKNILKNFKNRYFRRRFILFIFCAIFLIAILYGGFKIASNLSANAARREYENKIFGTLQEKSAEITEFYTYGTHFQIYGTLDAISADNFENAKLVLVSENTEKEFAIEGNVQDNKLMFSSAGLINSGINLDELGIDTYYLKLRLKLNNSTEPKYYTLVNSSSYPNIEYYTVTKNGKNNKVKIDFTEYQTIEEKNLSCLKIQVEEATLPDNVYDIVIDAGHGGKDSGVKAGGYEEKNITLDISKILKTELEQRGYKVKLTRDDENTEDFTATNMYDENGRIDIACKSEAKLMISLHINDGSSKMSGLEVYAPCKSDLTLARTMANKLIENIEIEVSNNTSFKETDGVYVNNFNANITKDAEETAKEKNYEPYPLTEDTPYLYTIREVGGIATNAYVDGRNTAYAKNVHYNSNQGIECYQIEMGYIDTDLQKIIEEEEGYAYSIAEAIAEAWK